MWQGSKKADNLRSAPATTMHSLIFFFCISFIFICISALIFLICTTLMYFYSFFFFFLTFLFPSCYTNNVACPFPSLRLVSLSPPSAAVTETHWGQAVRHDPDVEPCRHASHAEGHLHSAGRTDRRFKGLLGWHKERRDEAAHTAQPSQLTSRGGVTFSLSFLIHSCQTWSDRRWLSLCVKCTSIWWQWWVSGEGKDGGAGGGGDLARLGRSLPLAVL